MSTKTDNAEQVRSHDWLGISARTKLALQKAAAGWGLEITYAQWTRIRECTEGRIGGWAVEVRACGEPRTEWAFGYRLAQLYDDMERAVCRLAALKHIPRAEMPSARVSDCANHERTPNA